MEKKEIKNVKDLRDELIDVYTQLRSGELGIREVKERANVAGKIIASAKIQLEYNMFIKSGSKIEFLEC
jgi:hypothetical protein